MLRLGQKLPKAISATQVLRRRSTLNTFKYDYNKFQSICVCWCVFFHYWLDSVLLKILAWILTRFLFYNKKESNRKPFHLPLCRLRRYVATINRKKSSINAFLGDMMWVTGDRTSREVHSNFHSLAISLAACKRRVGDVAARRVRSLRTGYI